MNPASRFSVADYECLLAGVVHVIDEVQRATARAVNAAMTTTYWLIGRRIVEQEQRRPVLPICEALLPWLRNLEPGFVIRWKQDQQEPIKRIQTAFDAARTRAKFSPAITPYSIRHTVAVELRKRGVPLLGFELENQPTPGELRAHCVPKLEALVPQVIDFMVGVTGFEPATPTSRILNWGVRPRSR
jgi:hypothetical protein